MHVRLTPTSNKPTQSLVIPDDFVIVAKIGNDGERTEGNWNVVENALKAHNILIGDSTGSTAWPISVPRDQRDAAVRILRQLPQDVLRKIEFLKQEVPVNQVPPPCIPSLLRV